MITQADQRQLNKKFVVVDIENYAKPHKREGELISIGTMWRDKHGAIHFKEFFSWDDWFAWVVEEAKEHHEFRTLWAHNGGGWDWPSLIHWLLNNPSRYTKLTGCFGGFRNITCTIFVDGVAIKLCDSFLLFRSGLDALAKQFLGQGKKEIEVMPHVLWETDRDKYHEYLRRDCESLLLVLEKAIELVHSRIAPIGRFGVTVGSVALDVFRTGFLDREITCPTERDDDEQSDNRKLRPFLRLGYKGGRCEVFKYGRFENVRVYDVNSLYPWSMANTPVPTSDRGVWIKEYVPNLPGCYEIRFKQRNRNVPPVLLVAQTGVYEGTGVYFSPEIERLRQVDNLCEIEVIRGFIFQDRAIIFKTFVEKLYQLRLDNPDTPISLMSKFLMNNLYGKMAQHSGRESLEKYTSFADVTKQLEEWEDQRAKIVESSIRNGQSKESALAYAEKKIPTLTPYEDDDSLTFIKREWSMCKWEHVGIAGMITSAARVRLHEGLCSCNGSLLYCDTDSVHVAGNISESLVGNSLGLFKLEFPNKEAVFSEGVYAGRKLYSLRQTIDGKPVEKTRAKGVRVGGRNGFSLDFDKLNHMLQSNGYIETEFFTPDTMKAIWQGKTPNQFRKRTRKIRRT